MIDAITIIIIFLAIWVTFTVIRIISTINRMHAWSRKQAEQVQDELEKYGEEIRTRMAFEDECD